MTLCRNLNLNSDLFERYITNNIMSIYSHFDIYFVYSSIQLKITLLEILGPYLSFSLIRDYCSSFVMFHIFPIFLYFHATTQVFFSNGALLSVLNKNMCVPLTCECNDILKCLFKYVFTKCAKKLTFIVLNTDFTRI